MSQHTQGLLYMAQRCSANTFAVPATSCWWSIGASENGLVSWDLMKSLDLKKMEIQWHFLIPGSSMVSWDREILGISPVSWNSHCPVGQDLRARRDRKISSLYCFIVEQNNPFQKGFSVRDPQVPLSSSWLWLEEQHRHLNIWIWFPLLLKGTSHSPHKKACMPKSELRIQWGDRGGLML